MTTVYCVPLRDSVHSFNVTIVLVKLLLHFIANEYEKWNQVENNWISWELFFVCFWFVIAVSFSLGPLIRLTIHLAMNHVRFKDLTVLLCGCCNPSGNELWLVSEFPIPNGLPLSKFHFGSERSLLIFMGSFISKHVISPKVPTGNYKNNHKILYLLNSKIQIRQLQDYLSIFL